MYPSRPTRYVSPVLPRPLICHSPSAVMTWLIRSIGSSIASAPTTWPSTAIGVTAHPAGLPRLGLYAAKSASTTSPTMLWLIDSRYASERFDSRYGPVEQIRAEVDALERAVDDVALGVDHQDVLEVLQLRHRAEVVVVLRVRRRPGAAVARVVGEDRLFPRVIGDHVLGLQVLRGVRLGGESRAVHVLAGRRRTGRPRTCRDSRPRAPWMPRHPPAADPARRSPRRRRPPPACWSRSSRPSRTAFSIVENSCVTSRARFSRISTSFSYAIARSASVPLM